MKLLKRQLRCFLNFELNCYLLFATNADILVLHFVHLPCMRTRPLPPTISSGSAILHFFLHFIQYASTISTYLFALKIIPPRKDRGKYVFGMLGCHRHVGHRSNLRACLHTRCIFVHNRLRFHIDVGRTYSYLPILHKAYMDERSSLPTIFKAPCFKLWFSCTRGQSNCICRIFVGNSKEQWSHSLGCCAHMHLPCAHSHINVHLIQK